MKEVIKEKAIEIGFSAVGVTTAEPVDYLKQLKEAIREGRIAEMNWLSRDPNARCDPKSLLKDAKSVICCALAYGDAGVIHHCAMDPMKSLSSRDPSASPQNDNRARYARGEDYHDVILDKLKKLRNEIKIIFPNARSKLCVDTSPIMEKALAMRAGIGWIGKHTILLNHKMGSWFILGEIITDIDLSADAPAESYCGKCTACIDACPTRALVRPHTLDARRCISYKGGLGCDVCQEACPYNQTIYNADLS